MALEGASKLVLRRRLSQSLWRLTSHSYSVRAGAISTSDWRLLRCLNHACW